MRSTSLLLMLCLTACGGKKEPVSSMTTRADMVSEQPVEGGNLIQQEVDLDQDGQPEIYNYLRERADAARLLVRKEMDLNRDGKVDIISWFDNDGQLEKEEMDSDYDGTFDHTDHYKDGARVMSEYDTDYDGVANVHKYYVRNEAGVPVLDRKERDEDGDGRIDVWERFNEDGQVTRTGRDTDGDGKMDVREE